MAFVPRQSCRNSYIAETGRLFKNRKQEHEEETKEASKLHYPLTQRKPCMSTITNKP